MRTSRLASFAALSLIGIAAACSDDRAGDLGGADAGSGAPPARAEFGLDARPTNPTCRAPARPASTQPVRFERVYESVNLEAPMMLAQKPGDGSFFYAALRDGRIVRFASNAPAPEPLPVANLASLAGMPVQQVSEGGLLGFAFHPRFSENGKLFVSWVTNGGPSDFRSVVGVLTSPDGGATFTSYETILGPFDQPAGNHNGGGIAFGRDGLLFLSFGDGGGSGDQFGHGQETTTFFSKILRIDVDNPGGGKKYGIPATNPFATGGGEPATFAFGFRNPFRISVDRETGDVWTGDVGQDRWEEVDKVELGGNYGWPCLEASYEYKPAQCASLVGLAPPVTEHKHVPESSRSITGGVVYRGKAIPALVGSYVYGDYVSQELFSVGFDPVTTATTTTLLNADGPSASWVAFGEDVDGEVYAVALNQGSVYKLVPIGGAPAALAFPARLSETGCVDPQDPRKPAAGLVPYGVNAELWSDGADKERFLALPDGKAIDVDASGDFSFPVGTVLVKTFAVAQKRIETRLFVRHDDGDWGGYSYEWNDAQTDATLLPGGKTKDVAGLTWSFPSRAECMRCHTQAAGRSLGLELGQQNGDFVYARTNRIANQLRTFEHIGLFSSPLGKPAAELPALPQPFGGGPVDGRARAYLHANCSGCHRPEGGGRGALDLRFSTPLAETASCDREPDAGDLGIPGSKLLAPGAPSASLLVLRPKATGKGRMPPLGSRVVDTAGVDLLEAWVRATPTCP